MSFLMLRSSFLIMYQSNTTSKKGSLMNPLKGGNFGIHFHRPDEISATEI